LELIRLVGDVWQNGVGKVLALTVIPVLLRPKTPNGVAVVETVRVTGVLVAQEPPIGVMVTVPEATPVTTVPLTLAIEGLELVRPVGLVAHDGKTVVA
jgi:hypothetical protein